MRMAARLGLLLAVVAVVTGSPVTGMAVSAQAIAPDREMGAATAGASATDLLRAALERAQAAGSYRLAMDVQQTVAVPVPVLGDSAPAEQSARIRIEGQIGGPQKARLTLTDGDVRGRLPQSPVLTPTSGQEVLVAGGAIYQREGDAWIRQPDAVSAPGLSGDALMLLEVARGAMRLGETHTLGGTFERVAFALDSRDVLAYMLRRSGAVDQETQLRLQLSGLEYSGTGELWIDGNGLPARLALNLSLARGGADPYRAYVVSTTTYSGFGESFPTGWFDPTRAPLSRVSTSPIPGSGLTQAQVLGAGLLGVIVVAISILLLGALQAGHHNRRAYSALSVALIIALLGPTIAQAAAPGSTTPSPEPSQPSAVESMLLNARDLNARQREHVAAQAGDLDSGGDEDGDGLPNGYELALGTNPFAADSDVDGLTDAQEVLGVPCTTGTTTVMVETDPLNPDSNADGIRDGDEVNRGACRYTATGNRPPAWDDDNDSDGVPDDLDLSPFSSSAAFGAEGANLSFETLASLPGIAPREVYYFELQVVPDEARTLQYAYKSALEWPVDDKGLIQHDPDSGTTGMLEIAPFLEVTLDNDDLPGGNAMAQYGVGAAPVPLDDGSPSGESTMVIPLAPIERGGVIYALQAKVFQDHPSADGIIRWRDARLKWAVQGDVLRADDDGAMVPSPTGGYGLVVYDEPYRITGVQTSRQGGAASLVAGAVRTEDDSNAGPVALLRGALEAQYLGGRLPLADIYARFNLTSSAAITERWGITQTFGISLPAYFRHMDEMLLTTNVTTTRGLLNTYYPAGDARPTLLIATEQRTATLNADDLPSPDFANLVLNVCVTEMVTSRTLKLATYRYDPATYRYDPTAVGVASSQTPGAPVGTMTLTAGDWTMLGLDEVLADIKAEFDALYGTLEDAYNEAVTMLQMAMTVWYQGQTVVQAIGDLDLTNVTDALGDAAFYANILSLLDQVGLFDGLPSEFRVAVEFLLGVLEYPGGPAQWFEDQWNSVVTMTDEIVGSFKDYAAGDFTPDSLVSFTQTGINVLTWLASIFDFGFLGDAVKVLSRLLEIFTKVQQLWNTIQVLATQGVQVVSDVLKAVTGELTSLAGNLQFVGLILSVFTTLFSMFIQLAAGTLSVLGVIGVILKAVIEIAIAVVLFVVSTLFPIGTLVAIGIALIKLVSGFLKDYLGDVGAVLAAILDPIGAILEAANPDPEPLATFLGSPRVGPMQFRTFQDEPLGGLIAGDRFGFEITGTVTMAGSAAALNRSSAWLQLGRYATGDTFELCGLQILQYLTDSGQLDQVPGYTSAIVQGGCRTFRFDREPTWSYARSDSRQRSGIYFTDTVPGTDFPLPGNYRVRDYDTTARLTVDPHKPQINGVVSADVTLDVRQLWENCGVFGIDCDVYVEHYETSPSAGYVYFDIFPRTLTELWDWEDLTNHDPDADGLAGNLAQGVLGFDNGLCGNPNSFRQRNSETVGDRLTDTFELFYYESSPCLTDTDNDGLNDHEDFILGTNPRKADTDGDGLKDGEEIARWNPGWLTLSVPWRVDMGGAYPGLPNPAAFPNPRIANADRDARSDRKEKMLFSSPNAFNVSDIAVAISQELVEGGGTQIRLTGFPWPNDLADLAPGLSPVLTMTLPISLDNVTTSARLVSKGISLTPGTPGTPVVGTPANVYAWTFSPLTLNRLVQVTLSGLPASIPADEVFLTVN
ncbi:MAG: hypothetical protein MUF84_20970, partial [Anaerolineae bacterium]|nr:hypothetical protein [Anaerolineae bacterium]